MNDTVAIKEVMLALDLYFKGNVTAEQAVNTIAYITGLNAGK